MCVIYFVHEQMIYKMLAFQKSRTKIQSRFRIQKSVFNRIREYKFLFLVSLNFLI